ncbi:hypothetical protein [Chitinimonas sp. BJYL2]|uniref:hypothetical protein n=1 Tax=Chitinimonas sp. BJYL2 TaxID=2976696 RepID=UPI0022B4FF36|nr:hypothetical protein [Chitinimonas sp. BJYL2]
MNLHYRIVATLHIVFALLFLLVLAVLVLFTGAIMQFADIDSTAMQIIGGTAGVLAAPFALLAVGQLIAGLMLLRGSRGARIWVIVFGILELINFPFGTALGIYTLWALLQPDTSGQPAARN